MPNQKSPTPLEILRANREAILNLDDYLEYADMALRIFGFAHISRSTLDNYIGNDSEKHYQLVQDASREFGWGYKEGVLVFSLTRIGERKASPIKFGQTTKEDVKSILREAKSDSKAQSRAKAH